MFSPRNGDRNQDLLHDPNVVHPTQVSNQGQSPLDMSAGPHLKRILALARHLRKYATHSSHTFRRAGFIQDNMVRGATESASPPLSGSNRIHSPARHRFYHAVALMDSRKKPNLPIP